MKSVGGASFTMLAAVMAIGLAAPLIVNLRPSLRMPAAVVEIVLGVVLGPSGLGWVRVDEPVAILSELGLATLLFLAGLEIDTRALRHGVRRLATTYLASIGIAVLIALGVSAAERINSPLLVGLALASSTVGLVAPILHDSGTTDTRFGQTALAGTSVAEFGAILLISLFFSQHASSTGSRIFLLCLFGVVAAVIALALSGLARSRHVTATLRRLERTSAQLGVRFAAALMSGFAALATALGLETILAVFIAGVILRMVDEQERLIHLEFRLKVEAIGYGFLVPVFFVTSGLQLNFGALFDEPGHVLLSLAFLIGLLAARGLPALAYRRILGARRAVSLGLLQSISLPVIVIIANLGHELRVFDDATDAALVVAGVLSVLVFPSAALSLLGGDELRTEPRAEARQAQATPHSPAGSPQPADSGR